jgi:hypothetical protein
LLCSIVILGSVVFIVLVVMLLAFLSGGILGIYIPLYCYFVLCVGFLCLHPCIVLLGDVVLVLVQAVSVILVYLCAP